MWLVGPENRRISLCYSMNVHPGEGLDDVLSSLREFVVPLKKRLGVTGPMAVGLRLARQAAEESESRAGELKTLLDAEGLEAVTCNAFPFGDFHAESVKEDVYRPDWSDGKRATYTLRCAVVLAAMNARRKRVSLSTVPLSFKGWGSSINASIGRLLDLVNPLSAVERKSGVRVRVGLEPEPFCLLETARETAEFWTSQFRPAARARFGPGAEVLVKSYLGVCVDTCHHAVRWEELAAVYELYKEAEIPVTKIQLSSALEAPSTDELQPFVEPRYLHQVVAQSGEARVDLPGPKIEGPVRCHFHVPVHKTEVGGVATTRQQMLDGLAEGLRRNATDCYEIETYTWDVLPLREGELLDSLEAEYKCVLEAAASEGYVAAP